MIELTITRILVSFIIYKENEYTSFIEKLISCKIIYNQTYVLRYVFIYVSNALIVIFIPYMSMCHKCQYIYHFDIHN